MAAAESVPLPAGARSRRKRHRKARSRRGSHRAQRTKQELTTPDTVPAPVVRPPDPLAAKRSLPHHLRLDGRGRGKRRPAAGAGARARQLDVGPYFRGGYAESASCALSEIRGRRSF